MGYLGGLTVNIERIKYSKCPNCGNYGIDAVKTYTKYNPTLTCKYCGCKFIVNRAMTIFVYIIIVIATGSVGGYFKYNVFDIPSWLIAIIALFFIKIFDYFAPLTKID